MNSEIQSSGADRIGRFCALSHQRPEVRLTAAFVSEIRREVCHTAYQLRLLMPLCSEERDQLSHLETSFLAHADALPSKMPETLPFLPLPRPHANAPRVVILMREWLLMAPRTHQPEQLEEFLMAYQEIFPLQLDEIRILPYVFRLAVAERCQFLPSAATEQEHRSLLPILIDRIYQHLRFVEQINWKKLGENVSKVHHLLSHDPAGIYPQMDFLSRDAYRHQVEEIARRTGANESSIASRATALAGLQRQTKRDFNHVGHFLLGYGRTQLLDGFSTPTNGKITTSALPSSRRPATAPNPHSLQLDFSSGIPSDKNVLFLLPVQARDPSRLQNTLHILSQTAEKCREADDIQIGLLLTGILHERLHSSLLREIQGTIALLNVDLSSPQIFLFIQTRNGLRTVEAIRSAHRTLILFDKARSPAWFRQYAGFWHHPLNRARFRFTRLALIRHVAARSSVTLPERLVSSNPIR